MGVVDDQEELERELSWTRPTDPTRRRERPPAGYRAAVAISSIYALLAVALVLKATDRLTLGGELGTIVAKLGSMVIGVLVALKLGFSTWRAIGATLRSIIRPLMVLGTWPIYIAALAGLVLITAALGPQGGIATQVAPTAEPASTAPTEKRREPVPRPKVELRRLAEPVRRAMAPEACSALGPEWRLARYVEFPAAGALLAASAPRRSFWVDASRPGFERPPEARPLICSAVACRVDQTTVHYGEGVEAEVLCARNLSP